MRDFKEEMLTGDIKSAMSFVSVAKWSKVILAVLVVLAYFTGIWLTEIIVISVIISLIVPLGFFDIFIQKLLEYNTQKLEERQIINVQETNEHLEKMYKKVGK